MQAHCIPLPRPCPLSTTSSAHLFTHSYLTHSLIYSTTHAFIDSSKKTFMHSLVCPKKYSCSIFLAGLFPSPGEDGCELSTAFMNLRDSYFYKHSLEFLDWEPWGCGLGHGHRIPSHDQEFSGGSRCGHCFPHGNTLLHSHQQFASVLVSPRPGQHWPSDFFDSSHQSWCEVVSRGRFTLHFPSN